MYTNSLNTSEDMLCLSLIGRGKKQQVDHHIIICEENHVWSPEATADMGWFQDKRVDSGGGITVEHGPSRSFFGTPSSLQSLRQDFS